MAHAVHDGRPPSDRIAEFTVGALAGFAGSRLTSKEHKDPREPISKDPPRLCDSDN
jgi:hypothetical protein